MTKMGCETREIPPPPIFPEWDSTSEEQEQETPQGQQTPPEQEIPHDQETLGERVKILRHERGQSSRPQRFTATTHRGGRLLCLIVMMRSVRRQLQVQ